MTDTAGTMRDPVIYKAGEDYYSKAFSGTQNRWGDYSHAAVDPSNDRDLWVVQEYAGTRTVPDANTTTNNSRWGTYWAKVTAPAVWDDLITGTNPACPANTCTVQGTMLEEPPSQPNGGAFNSTLSVDTVTLAAPVAPGASVNDQLLLGIQQTGTFKFIVNIEVLP